MGAVKNKKTPRKKGNKRVMQTSGFSQAKEPCSCGGGPSSGIYTHDDMCDFDYEYQLGYPGQYPFTRGIQPTMYRGRLWTMRQYAGFGTAQDTNKRYKYLLQHGQTGLSVAFDLPTQIGYDADDPHSRGEVGKVGVSISSLKDMETLFDGIPLEKVSTSMTINSTAAVLLAMYVAVAKKQGADITKLQGTIQNDILKEYVARGTYIYPPAPSMRIITDIFQWCGKELPRWNTISISGYHIREAGSTASQEVAFTLANAIAYVEAAVAKGLDIDQFAGRLSFFFGSHNNFLEEVAKFRAARRMWAHIMKERFRAKDPRSMQLRFHTQTAGCTLTAQQPENNVVRVGMQALAAVMGGTQSLHTNSMDEALALPTELAVKVALRTQQVIGHETGVASTIDPFAGSWAVEAMTDRIEREAAIYIGKIEKMGGVLRAIEQGFIQKEISQSAYEYQKRIETGENVIVGVNRFREETKLDLKILRVDPGVEKSQVERLSKLKSERDTEAVRQRLAVLETTARSSDNIMPAILACVNEYATLGEICNTLRGVFGEYRSSTMV